MTTSGKMEEGIQCAQFIFYNNFDSANLLKVEFVPPSETVVIPKNNGRTVIPEVPDAEFNVWTRPDCWGTEFENGNRTWFYFGMKAPEPSLLVKFNMVDLNRQGKMYSQGMAPVFRIVPGKSQWDRIRDKPVYAIKDDIFTLSFKIRTPENIEHVMYFAFTYPFSYVELDKMLCNIDQKYLTIPSSSEDDIYYVRECVCHSLENRSVDLLTITSFHGITNEREVRLTNLFKDRKVPRPHKFTGKKVVFISARVHPGETPSSFVFNGLLSTLLNREDLVAIMLRRMYVFKLIPFLNPDGVARGHYRTDTRGVNLNRVYRNPSLSEHPSVYAARALIRYYHFGFEKEDLADRCDNCSTTTMINNSQNDNISQQVSQMKLEEGDNGPTPWCWKCKKNIVKLEDTMPGISTIIPTLTLDNSLGRDFCRNCGCKIEKEEPEEEVKLQAVGSHGDVNSNESGLFLYIDLHGHASKKGIFMYGNHFNDTDRNVECMLLPKLMSINNHNFHFNACNFTERNMYLRDKRDGMSRAGSGRVAVLSLTGLVRSYTLECNYNTGRIVNVLPPSIKDVNNKCCSLPVPPKYTPLIFEEVGRSLCQSILDLTGNNPWTRLPNSEFHTLSGLREWLRIKCMNEYGESKVSSKMKVSSSLQTQGKTSRGMVVKSRQPLTKLGTKKCRPIPVDRKENLYHQLSPTSLQSRASSCQPSCSKSSLRLNKCFGLKAKSLKNKSNTEKSKGILGRTKPAKANVVTSQKVRLDMSSKVEKNEKVAESNSDLVQLHEICFIKNNEGKTVIAKYKSKDGEKDDENLIVSWGAATTNALVYTGSAPAFLNKAMSEPGPSKPMGSFRVHHFAKAAKNNKLTKKLSLRRLASAGESISKVEKKKKKKLKGK